MRFFSFAYISLEEVLKMQIFFSCQSIHTSPGRNPQEMLRWAASTQDGVGTLGLDDVSASWLHGRSMKKSEVILRQVIEEAWFACQTFETFKIFFFEICRSRHCVRIPCPWFQQGSACRSFRWVRLNELPNRLANELIPGGNQAANQPHPGLDHSVIDPEEERRITLYTRLNYLKPC